MNLQRTPRRAVPGSNASDLKLCAVQPRRKVERIVKWLLLILSLGIPVASFAQQPDLPVSEKYPLKANIVSVETEVQQDLTNSEGKTSELHLVKAEIEGKTYRLAVKLPLREKRPFQHRSWLQPGLYPARRITHGFEFEYRDGDKIRHEELRIATEE
jgi:hypothetical protein